MEAIKSIQNGKTNHLVTMKGLAYATNMDLFPEEMLEHTFSFVDDISDLRNVAKSSDQFDRIVGKTKQVWLFEEAFPSIFPQLNKVDVLNCRVVCRKWKKSVDLHLQTQPHTRFTEGYNSFVSPAAARNAPAYAPQFHYNLVRKPLVCLQLHDMDTISRFQNYVQSFPASHNPFTLRSISVDGGSVPAAEQETYWTQIIELLEHFGRHVWHLYFHVSQSDFNVFPLPQEMYCYNVLYSCISNMPNLKNIVLYQYNPEHDLPFLIPPLPSDVTQLQNHIKNLQMPELCSLESIEIELTETVENVPLCVELLKKYLPVIKTAIIHLSTLKTCKYKRILSTPNLTSLSIYVDESLDQWKRICKIIQAPNLSKLMVGFKTNGMIIILLMQLQKFPTLKYLQLRFNQKPMDFGFKRFDPPAFSLGQIKTLEIVDNLHVPYDLLFAYMPNLEYLLVCGEESWVVVHDEWTVEQRHFYFHRWSFLKSLQGKCIWTQLKSLRELTMAWMGTGMMECHEIMHQRKYTREMYQTVVPKCKL